MAVPRNRKGATVAQVLSAVEGIAPPALAEPWDNVGLQVGARESRIARILVALEASSDVLREAARLRVGAIVAHHPLIFRERKTFAEVDPVSRIAADLTRRRIAFIVAHTNLDSVRGGTNGVLLERCGLMSEVRFLRESPRPPELVKFSVFVPESHVAKVIDAIAAGGGGAIGNYSHCTFRTPGTGTFRPLDGAKPFIGSTGRLEEVAEFRVEAVCPRGQAGKLVESVRRAHPYEEMAYDVVAMEPDARARHGLGLVGTLVKPTTLGELGGRLAQAIPGAHLSFVGEDAARVRTIAVCSGAGGEFVRTGRVGGADVLVTGEMSHHDAWEARERGIGVVLVGHFQSEVIVCDWLAAELDARLRAMGSACSVLVSSAQGNPLRLAKEPVRTRLKGNSRR